MPASKSSSVDLTQYARVVWRRKWIVLAALVVAVALGVAYSFSVTPIYQATSQVIVDTETAQSISFAGGSGQFRDPNEYFNTQKEILASRPFLDSLARKLKLDQDPYFLRLKRTMSEERGGFLTGIAGAVTGLFASNEAPPLPLPDVQTASTRELDPFIVNVLRSSLSGAVGRARNIMKINCVARDPRVAAAIASGAAEALVAYNLSLRVKPYQNTADWLASQIVESKKKVEKIEQKMQGYREGKGDQTVLAQQLQVLFTQLNETENRKLEARERLRKLQTAFALPESLLDNPEILANPIAMGYRNEERALSRQLADLSEKYGPQHPQIIRVTAELKTVRKSYLDEARKMLAAAKTDAGIAEERVASLNNALEVKKREIQEISRQDVQFNILGGEAGTSKSFYEMLIKKMEEMSLAISSGINVSVLQVMELATPPSAPIKPRRGLILQFSILAGLFGGLFLAFIVEHLDNTVRTPEDVENLLKVPYLDLVPLSGAKKGQLFITEDPTSTVAESFRTIRTGLLLSSIDKPPKVILVTSSVPNEGKTTVSANLAVAFAQMGENVLVIDTDMRRHNLHELFDLNAASGLSDVLRNPETLSESIKKPSPNPQLMVLTGGTTVPNPSEMLGSGRMKQLVAVVSGRFDRVILDAPPLKLFSDALVLSQLADGVIMVVWGGSTPRSLIQQSIESLRSVRANILGVVLNKVDVSKGSGHYYKSPYYTNYYSEKKGKKRQKS